MKSNKQSKIVVGDDAWTIREPDRRYVVYFDGEEVSDKAVLIDGVTRSIMVGTDARNNTIGAAFEEAQHISGLGEGRTFDGVKVDGPADTSPGPASRRKGRKS